MNVSRIAGGVLLTAAAVAIAADIVAGVNAGAFQPRPLGQHWFDLHPPSLNFSQALIQRYLHPNIWDPAIVLLLNLPTWLVLGPMGSAFWFVRRRRNTPAERERPLP